MTDLQTSLRTEEGIRLELWREPGDGLFVISVSASPGPSWVTWRSTADEARATADRLLADMRRVLASRRGRGQLLVDMRAGRRGAPP